MGRSSEGIEKRREQDRLRKRRKYADPEWRAKHLAEKKQSRSNNRALECKRSQEYYWKNRDRILSRHREYAKKSRERIREYRREWNARNREDLADRAKHRRRQNDPTVGLIRLTRELEKGNISINDYVERFEQALVSLNEKSYGK